ncbi:helix-turn-helix domain-containing protein [Agromyces badenianii]|uniref:helix-turn-helix domain-containing protein n=1 Tax=Agromyces badenianii TaxID=2080742 RepID=UPI000D5A0228|nr:helix-turn-helix transcriptional regulator [Agromyces badenianii]PWC04255.1 hypothetical protein DCE94_08865 [Agromyces badenianii]
MQSQQQTDTIGAAEQSFGRAVLSARESRRLTQRQLVDKLAAFGLAIDTSILSRIETGQRSIRLGEALVIANALDVELFALLGQTRSPVGEFHAARRWADSAELTLEEPLREFMNSALALRASLVETPGLLSELPEESQPADADAYLDWRSERTRRRLAELIQGGRDGIQDDRDVVFVQSRAEVDAVLALVRSYAEALIRFGDFVRLDD